MNSGETIVCNFWGEDFKIPSDFSHNAKKYNQDAIFQINKEFRRKVKFLLRGLEKYGILNLFWEYEETEVCAIYLRKFFLHFENIGKVIIFSDFNKKNLVIIYPGTPYFKKDLDYWINDLVVKNEKQLKYKKKYEKRIFWSKVYKKNLRRRK